MNFVVPQTMFGRFLTPVFSWLLGSREPGSLEGNVWIKLGTSVNTDKFGKKRGKKKEMTTIRYYTFHVFSPTAVAILNGMPRNVCLC